jgi:hypothetical protein
MSTTERLDRAAYRPYFDHVSRLLEGRRADIDITALNIGDQIAAKQLPLLGVSYDPHDDSIAIMVEGLNHMVRHPREVFVQTEGSVLSSMEVIDADGVSHIVRFSEPLMLPAPH